MQAGPTIIEDNCFIGARSEVVEGVVVGEGSVISMGVFIGQSTKIVDRQTGEIHMGKVPPFSVVVSGSLPGKPHKADRIGEQANHPHARQQRQEEDGQASGVLRRHEGERGGGADKQPGDPQHEARAPGPFGSVEGFGRRNFSRL
jgi:carbonic anhydrase/acetyltransferase-like protein (isoleucine patch superfamily)